jgi:hypothetical protein
MEKQQGTSFHHGRKVEALESMANLSEPFATFTWEHWMTLQARVNQGFSRYLRAIESGRIDLALAVTLEIMETAADLLKEAIAWVEPPAQTPPEPH